MKRNLSSYLLLFGLLAIISSTTPGCKSKPKDAGIKASIETALNADPQTAGLMIDVKDGVVTINGVVKDTATHSAAAKTASGVKGVKSVQNNITVEAPPVVEITPDDPLTIAVRDATKDFPGAVATVKDGVITVTGELKADDWKRLKMALDGLKPKKVDAAGLKISK